MRLPLLPRSPRWPAPANDHIGHRRTDTQLRRFSPRPIRSRLSRVEMRPPNVRSHFEILRLKIRQPAAAVRALRAATRKRRQQDAEIPAASYVPPIAARAYRTDSRRIIEER